MTVSIQYTPAVFTGNGVTTDFNAGWRIFANEDVRVFRITIASGALLELAYGTEFTVSGAGSVDNATITTATAYSSSYQIRIERHTELVQETDFVDGDSFPAETVEDLMDRMTHALQEQDARLERAILVPQGETLDELGDADARADRVLAFDSTGQPTLIVGVDSGSAAALSLDLANSSNSAKGDALVAVKKTVTGAVGTTQHAVNEARRLDAALDFGCDKTGAVNCTTAMKAFFDACIAGSLPGYIPAGDYKVTTGVLVFDCAFTDTPWPNISTAGHDAVRFLVDAATATNAPVLTISNGTASSAVGQYWRGGELGGFTIVDATGATAASRHGLSLRGMWGTRFGRIAGSGLRASVVYLPETLYSGLNPDPYAMSFCDFAGVEADLCVGWAFENRNWVGFNFCRVEHIRATNGGAGAWYGFGSGNSVGMVSLGTCSGWALDDGTHTAATGGAPNKLFVGACELDDPEYGIRINRLTAFTFGFVRFVHRYHAGPDDYWPRQALLISDGASPNTNNGTVTAVHRVESGGDLVDLGSFVDGSSDGNISNVVVNFRLEDNSGLSVVAASQVVNISSTSTLKVMQEGRPLVDYSPKVAAFAVSATSATVPNSGFGTTSAKIVFATERYDIGGYYSTVNSEFTVPYAGLYKVRARIMLALAAGEKVRLAVAADRGGSISYLSAFTGYAVGTGAQSYETGGVFDVLAGDKLFVMADQNSASATVALSAPLSAPAELQFSIEAI